MRLKDLATRKPRQRAAKARTRNRRSWNEIRDVLQRAFRSEFKEDTVDISHGYGRNIHVLVVSRKFDRMTENEKQQTMWRIIDRTDLTPDEKSLISLTYPVSPAEIK